MEKIENWLLYTTVGNFILLFIISVLIESLILFIYPDWLPSLINGSFIMSFLFSLKTENDRFI